MKLAQFLTSRAAGAATLDVPPAVDRSPLDPQTLGPGPRDVRRRLLAAGASTGFADLVVRAVLESGARGAYCIDAAARILGASFSVSPSPKRGTGANLIAFVGPTGCGKTSTLAKLGRKLRQAGRSIAFASFDRVGATALERVGGVDADTDRMEIPLIPIEVASDLRRLLRSAEEYDAILIDTPGFSPRDDKGLERLARELEQVRRRDALDTYLVLPATAGRASLRLACDAFVRARADAAILTKLDETNAPGGALETVAEADFAFAFLCDGQDVRGHLHRPRPDHFADLLLRGKLA